ncbi:MAG: YkgJ family cysteine cluster protein [Candidatus Electronema sp. V4]|uniref:YkgJ family cysteine cluster protein n=1 Tax=Candidatus Electronema sp. V4 TaxID=3454756 RepID=UPI0040557145
MTSQVLSASNQMPEHCRPMSGSDTFRFACHSGVACFNECCRQLDLALTPYDVLRLKNRLKLDSGVFLERYVIVEWEEGMRFPHCYLNTADDDRSSCVFVSGQGCGVYDDRPSACRAYPAGRGASRRVDGAVAEQYVLMREPHCLGFAAGPAQTVPEYFQAQGLADYNRYNDQLLQLLHHPQVRAGFRPNRAQADQFILALYNLDLFRREVMTGQIKMKQPLSPMEFRSLSAGDDRALLLLAVRWLMQEYFNECWTSAGYRSIDLAA